MKYSFRISACLSGILSLFCLGFALFGAAQLAEASGTAACPEDPDFWLTVNGGCSATIVNGDSVRLDWYINVPVENCVINNGVGSIDVTGPLPIIGTVNDTPPTDASTPYTITCDGVVQTATVDVFPEVTLSIDGGSPQTADSRTGHLWRTTVRWDSQFADSCSPMWRTTASNPTPRYTSSNSQDNSNRLGTSGWAAFDNWPNGGYIYETTTFHITCYNSFRGTETTESITLVVEDPPPPPPIGIDMWADSYTVSPDYRNGFAYARVGFNAYNVTWCTYRAELEDGTRYGSEALAKYGNDFLGYTTHGPLPNGFGLWGGHSSRTFTSIELATTTRLIVNCQRGEVTIGDDVYPLATTSASVLIRVVDGEGEEFRADLPPVTVSVSATPTSPVKHPLTGLAPVEVTVTPENAHYCRRDAYRYNEDSGIYDEWYDLTGWTESTSVGHRPEGYTKVPEIATTTRFEVNCYRPFDLIYGNAAEQVAASSETAISVTPVSPAESVSPPVAYLYGNAVRWDSSDILASAIVNTGFSNQNVAEAVGGGVMQTDVSFVGTAEISFPFTHPHGASDNYDIHVQYCDETDGESTFEILTERGGIVAAWTTNNPNAGHQYCNSYSLERERVAQSINIEDGEVVAIRCTKAADDLEPCRLDHIWFGAGNGSTVVVPVDPNIGFKTMNVQWLSDYATRCEQSSKIGTRSDGSTFNYASTDSTLGNTNILISETTSFGLRCGRAGDSLTDETSMNVVVPTTFTLSSESLVSSGECWYNGQPASLPYTIGQTIDAPDGFIADTMVGSPNPGACIPAVDLAAVSPSVNMSGLGTVVDSLNGIYDGIDILVGIENLGPGALPENSNIAYSAQIGFPELNLATSTSAIAQFNGSISAPPGLSQSPPLSLRMDSLPFGTHQVCARVNLDNAPENYPEALTNFDNNIRCTNVTLPVPRPQMNLSLDRTLVRPGQEVTINWSAHTNYSTECTIRGPGGLDETFSADENYTSPPGSGGPVSGSFTTGPLTSSAEFTLTCTEDELTGTVHQPERIIVEVLPESQEI